MLCVIMLGAAMLNLTLDCKLAYKIMPVANALAYSAMMKYGHYALWHYA